MDEEFFAAEESRVSAAIENSFPRARQSRISSATSGTSDPTTLFPRLPRLPFEAHVPPPVEVSRLVRERSDAEQDAMRLHMVGLDQ